MPLNITKNIPSKYKAEIEGDLVLFNVPVSEIQDLCTKLYSQKGSTLKSIFATDERNNTGDFRIYYMFGFKGEKYFAAPYISLKKTEDFPSLTDTIYEAAFFEREIATMFGLTPIGHKSLQPIILHANWPKNKYPLRKDFKWNLRPKTASTGNGLDYKFQVVEGEGIYEIPVGPIHAGIIEPGHFRFSVAGEEIVNLEPMLGYVHKGTEKLFETLPLLQKISLSEHVSGDSSFSHSLAFCQAVEKLASDNTVPLRAQYLRVIFAELERLANHLGDLGFIMNDTGFSFGGSQLTRLREMIMQINENISGHRFLRGVNTFGGVNKDLDQKSLVNITNELSKIEKDFAEIINICEDTESVINRLKGTGTLRKDAAIDHGVVGVAARASGISVDTRIDFPYAAYEKIEFAKAVQTSCDVYARFRIRVQEVHSSINIINKSAKLISKGNIVSEIKTVGLRKNSKSFSVVEGWRGEIFYFVMTDSAGEISRVSVRDASFLNWPAVPHAVSGNIVPDFPLINKSFNLSYSGNDR